MMHLAGSQPPLLLGVHVPDWQLDLRHVCLHRMSRGVRVGHQKMIVMTTIMSVVRLTWLLKEWLYRDRSWETPCTLGSAIFLFIGMGLGFWSSIVFLTTSQVRHQTAQAA